jgi:ribosomal protein S18 acetylase RimI-like enzyme
MSPQVRRIAPSDDLAAITSLIHAAYAPHLAAGLRYWGTHQSVASTVRRLASGTSFVIVDESQYIGTVVVRRPQPKSQVPLYREPDVWSISQFCIAPAHKGTGLGRMLHDTALAHASTEGAKYMALDTAEPATTLIALYKRWGYSVVGTCDWRPNTNYLSVLMKRPVSLGDGGEP